MIRLIFLLNIFYLPVFASSTSIEISCKQSYGLNYLKKIHQTLLTQDGCPTGKKEVGELNKGQLTALAGYETCSKMTQNFRRTALPTFDQAVTKQLSDFKNNSPKGKCAKSAFNYETENYKELATKVLKYQRATDACKYVNENLKQTRKYTEALIKKCEPDFDKSKCELGDKASCLNENDESDNSDDKQEPEDDEKTILPSSGTNAI